MGLFFPFPNSLSTWQVRLQCLTASDTDRRSHLPLSPRNHVEDSFRKARHLSREKQGCFFGEFFVWVPIFDPTLVQYFIQIPHLIFCCPLSAYNKWWFEQKNHHIFGKSVSFWATLRPKKYYFCRILPRKFHRSKIRLFPTIMRRHSRKSSCKWPKYELFVAKFAKSTIYSLCQGSFQIKLSPLFPTEIEELTAGSEEIHSAARRDSNQSLAYASSRSNHWATNPRQELGAKFSLFTKLSVLFSLRGDPNCPRPSLQAHSNQWKLAGF